MKKVLLMMIMFCSMVFSEANGREINVILFTEGCYYGSFNSDGDIDIVDSLPSDRGKWELYDNCFVHTTNSGKVQQSTYWINKQSVKGTDDGVTFFATSDAGNTRLFVFTSETITVVYTTGDTNEVYYWHW